MDDNDRRLFDELIVAAEKLCTATDNAAVVLSEKFESMVTGPMRECQAVLMKCPRPTTAWDGTLRDEDLVEEIYRAPGQNSSEESRGVRIRHTITGIARESYSKRTQEDNRRVAKASLAEIVKRRYEAQSR